MAKTITQLMISIAASVNQDATAPTTGGSEWTLWLEFINRGIQEWAEANDWEVLRKVFYPVVSGLSQATMSLPLDFRKLADAPKLFGDTSRPDGESFPEELIERRGLHNQSEKYYNVRGDVSAGFNLVFHPATLASGASLLVEYYSLPTSLASPAQMPVVSDSQYLIDRTIGYVFEARSDPRFQQQEAKAREKLLLMIENADIAKYSSYANPSYVLTGPLARRGFRMGRD